MVSAKYQPWQAAAAMVFVASLQKNLEDVGKDDRWYSWRMKKLVTGVPDGRQIRLRNHEPECGI